MKTWQRNRAIHAELEDSMPDERIAEVVALDRYCDQCDGRAAHTRECPVGIEIRLREEQARAERAVRFGRSRR